MTKQPNNPDDHVGYGKPPKKHQFKKGQSGNPKGRPIKPKEPENYAQIMSRILGGEIIVQKNGKAVKVTYYEALVQTMVNATLKSNKPGAGLALLQHLVKTKIIHWEELYQQAICDAAVEWDKIWTPEIEAEYAEISQLYGKAEPETSEGTPLSDPDPDDESTPA